MLRSYRNLVYHQLHNKDLILKTLENINKYKKVKVY